MRWGPKVTGLQTRHAEAIVNVTYPVTHSKTKGGILYMLCPILYIRIRIIVHIIIIHISYITYYIYSFNFIYILYVFMQ